MNSKGFIWNHEWTAQAEKLASIEGMDAVFALMHAMSAYVETKEVPEDLSPVAGLLFDTMRKDLDHNRERYDAVSEQRRKAAAARWDKTNTDAGACDRMQPHATGCDRIEKMREHAADADIERRKEIEDNNIDVIKYGAEPESVSAPAEPPLITFLCTKGEEFGVTREFYDQLQEAYPAVNAMEQLKKIKSWCFANPKLRKTKGGAMRFVNNWFAKEQDRAAPQNARSGTTQRRLRPEEVAALPAIDPFAVLREG